MPWLVLLCWTSVSVAKRDTYHHGENTYGVSVVQSRINSAVARAEVIHLDDMDLRLSGERELINVTRLERNPASTHRARNMDSKEET